MKPITAVIAYSPRLSPEGLLSAIKASGLAERVLVVGGSEASGPAKTDGTELIPGSLFEKATLDRVLDRVATDYLLLLTGDRPLSLNTQGLEAMLEKAETTGAGMVYSDFYEAGDGVHPLNDYQAGSVRDGFDFGPVQLFSTPAVLKGRRAYPVTPGPTRFAALYDLRLRVAAGHSLYHVAEPLYTVSTTSETSSDEAMFAYVDPKNAAYQREMEGIFTDYLKGIGAYVPPTQLEKWDGMGCAFPVEASVIIPVRNRKGKVEEAVASALSQETDFPFNVIVVDNHSTDGTTEALADMAHKHSRLRHIVPLRTDLGIGGCWNEALYSTPCGRYAVQLDSDDLYSTKGTLQRIVSTLREGGFAMVVGSYTLVDQDLKAIDPGLIDHREWTDENGHNNALRVNGLGAPRAFSTEAMRAIGFLNASYGEDYAAALHICRQYRIGRIYESLYLCRRWSGNTDAALTVEETNRNDAFKDRIRTDEILARQQMIREQGE